jgi:hypothetical protein
MMSNLNEPVERYAAVWNEPDRERRRRSIAELWAEDGAHFTPSLEVRGHAASSNPPHVFLQPGPSSR